MIWSALNLSKESLLLHDFQVVACLILNDLNMVHVKGIHADVILLNIDHPHGILLKVVSANMNFRLCCLPRTPIKTPSRVQLMPESRLILSDGIDPTNWKAFWKFPLSSFVSIKKLVHEFKRNPGQVD